MGVLPAAHRDVVVVVDSSAALSGLFPSILKNYDPTNNVHCHIRSCYKIMCIYDIVTRISSYNVVILTDH